MISLSLILISGCAELPQLAYLPQLTEPKLYVEVFVVHEPEGLQDEILKQHGGSPGNQWKGQNPYLTGSAGIEWRQGYMLEIETGTSLFVGAPFNQSTPEELYWFKVKFGKKWGGYK